MKNLIIIAISLLCLIANAQSKIIIPTYVKMPKDSLVSKQLITDLNGFLEASQQENNLNNYVLPSEKIETFILVDEFKNVEYSRAFKDEHFFKPYLTNVVKYDDKRYLIQISHIGINDEVPYLRTSYNLFAQKTGNSFLFSSPLKENTKDWKFKSIKNFTFYFKETLDKKTADKFVKMASMFDKKLKSNNKITKLYCATNRTELLNLIGVDYRLDYNGKSSGVFSAVNDNEQLIVLGNNNNNFNNFDPHDLWHDRLKLVISRRLVNKNVDEACAYLYGGSWGLSWETIFNRFMNKVANNKNADWLNYKESRDNFGVSKAEHLIVDYVVTALMVQKIEKEKGFSGVWELLNCGKYEKGNENYYQVLEKLTGIKKENYNKAVWELINKENQ